MEKKLPSTIDIRLTSTCNKRCEFCFGTRVESDRTIRNWKTLLSRFREAGVESIVITGGEPATVPELGNLVSIAHDKGFTICLSTNGSIAFRSDLDLILENIKWISLPIEGDSYNAYNSIRNISLEEYNGIYSLMKYAKHKYNIGIKIGTVVTKQNIDLLGNIPSQIYEYADNWKLYQVYLEGKKEEIKEKYSVSLSEYYAAYERCKLICEKYSGLSCISYDASTMNGKYLFCEPNAEAMTIVQDEEFIIGSFLDDFELVCDKWNMYVNQNTLEENYYVTYRRRSGHE